MPGPGVGVQVDGRAAIDGQVQPVGVVVQRDGGPGSGPAGWFEHRQRVDQCVGWHGAGAVADRAGKRHAGGLGAGAGGQGEGATGGVQV